LGDHVAGAGYGLVSDGRVGCGYHGGRLRAPAVDNGLDGGVAGADHHRRAEDVVARPVVGFAAVVDDVADRRLHGASLVDRGVAVPVNRPAPVEVGPRVCGSGMPRTCGCPQIRTVTGATAGDRTNSLSHLRSCKAARAGRASSSTSGRAYSGLPARSCPRATMRPRDAHLRMRSALMP